MRRSQKPFTVEVKGKARKSSAADAYSQLNSRHQTKLAENAERHSKQRSDSARASLLFSEPMNEPISIRILPDLNERRAASTTVPRVNDLEPTRKTYAYRRKRAKERVSQSPAPVQEVAQPPVVVRPSPKAQVVSKSAHIISKQVISKSAQAVPKAMIPRPQVKSRRLSHAEQAALLSALPRAERWKKRLSTLLW